MDLSDQLPKELQDSKRRRCPCRRIQSVGRVLHQQRLLLRLPTMLMDLCHRLLQGMIKWSFFQETVRNSKLICSWTYTRKRIVQAREWYLVNNRRRGSGRVQDPYSNRKAFGSFEDSKVSQTEWGWRQRCRNSRRLFPAVVAVCPTFDITEVPVSPPEFLGSWGCWSVVVCHSHTHSSCKSILTANDITSSLLFVEVENPMIRLTHMYVRD